MAGTLYHGRHFRKVEYVSDDGNELLRSCSLDGDRDVMSASSWAEVAKLCEANGIPAAAWPVFESEIEVPLDEVRQKNADLPRFVASLPAHVTASSHWLSKMSDMLPTVNWFLCLLTAAVDDDLTSPRGVDRKPKRRER
jgi:hypothetical protein